MDLQIGTFNAFDGLYMDISFHWIIMCSIYIIVVWIDIIRLFLWAVTCVLWCKWMGDF